MIRMGRSNKTDQSSDTGKLQSDYANTMRTETESLYSMNRNAANDSISREMQEGSLSGYVGQGTVLNGEMSFQALLRVDGKMMGRIASESGTLIVGASGQIEANITVASAVVNGLIKGDIIASEKIELGRTAQVIGNIQTPRLVMEDGAVLEGNCAMLKSKELFENRVSADQSKFTDPATLDMTNGKNATAIS